MFKDLFSIIFRPQQTLDKVLFEKNNHRSWMATWGLLLVSSLTMLIYLIIVFSQKTLSSELTPEMDGLSRGILWVFVLIGWLVLTALSAGVMVLMRILFAWFVRMGLLISASDQYPTDPSERREKGKMLQLIHPYTLSIQFWPSAILTILMMVVMGIMFKDPQGLTDDMAARMAAGQLIIFVIVYILTLVISLGSYIYMIVVRVMAIKQIYNISGPRAFWGPFLIYFLFTVIPYLVLIIFSIIIGISLASSGMHNNM
jgi:hypothetical protein